MERDAGNLGGTHVLRNAFASLPCAAPLLLQHKSDVILHNPWPILVESLQAPSNLEPGLCTNHFSVCVYTVSKCISVIPVDVEIQHDFYSG